MALKQLDLRVHCKQGSGLRDKFESLVETHGLGPVEIAVPDLKGKTYKGATGTSFEAVISFLGNAKQFYTDLMELFKSDEVANEIDFSASKIVFNFENDGDVVFNGLEFMSLVESSEETTLETILEQLRKDQQSSDDPKEREGA